MKKIFVCLGIALTVTMAKAQSPTGTFSVTPRVGATFSNITKESMGFDSSSELLKGKTQVGFLAGAGMQYQISQVVAVSTGAYYQRMGCTYDDTDLSEAGPGDYTVYQHSHAYLDYLSVPVLAHLYVAKNFAIHAGVQASFLLNNSMRADISNVTIGKDGSYTYNEVEELDEENKFIRKSDLSIPVGISYEYENVVIGINYQLGLSKIYKSPLDNGNKNKAIVFSAGYKFDIGSI